MSISSGFVAAGFEPVREAFERNFEENLEFGAGFAVWAGDELVVDLHGGVMDRRRERAWTETTICPVFSTTKPVAALVIAMLRERGLIDYERPVADYWPKFGQAGKSEITVGEALSHQAGLPGFPEAIDPGMWLDPPALAARLAELPPMWGRGEGSGYHPLTWGYIAGELCRRVAGRSLGTVLREDICGPLDIDFMIGTPPSKADLCAQMIKPKTPTTFAHANAETRAAFQTPWSAPNRSAAEWRQVEIPSANGHGTAAGLARLYSVYALKGRIGETRLFSEAVWNELTRARVTGEDRVLPGVVSFGAGVMRNPVPLYGPGPETLCHSGWGGSGALGDPVAGVSAAYIMNMQGSHLLEDARRSRLIEALYACL
ncbi:MAG: serine hydrolase domain-containing protein [Hyphomonadaceae bacterium]